jgi:hypothetical protein
MQRGCQARSIAVVISNEWMNGTNVGVSLAQVTIGSPQSGFDGNGSMSRWGEHRLFRWRLVRAFIARNS